MAVKITVHIKIRCNPACQIFHDSQTDQPILILFRKFVFHRKDFFVQPGLQWHIVCIRTKKCHRCMRMRIFKSRQEKVIFHVNLAVPHFLWRIFRIAHIGDPVSLDMEFSCKNFPIWSHRRNSGMIEPYLIVLTYHQ